MARFTGPRGRTVPVPDWWLKEVNELVKGRYTQSQLVALIKARGARDISASTLSRVLDGSRPTLDVVEALSEILAVPCPVVVFSTRIDAQRYLADRSTGSLSRADSEVADIAAGVADMRSRRQADAVEPEHAFRDTPPTSLGRRRPSTSVR